MLRAFQTASTVRTAAKSIQNSRRAAPFQIRSILRSACRPLFSFFAMSARKLRTGFKAQLQSRLISRERELAFVECLTCTGRFQPNIFN